MHGLIRKACEDAGVREDVCIGVHIHDLLQQRAEETIATQLQQTDGEDLNARPWTLTTAWAVPPPLTVFTSYDHGSLAVQGQHVH